MGLEQGPPQPIEVQSNETAQTDRFDEMRNLAPMNLVDDRYQKLFESFSMTDMNADRTRSGVDNPYWGKHLTQIGKELWEQHGPSTVDLLPTQKHLAGIYLGVLNEMQSLTDADITHLRDNPDAVWSYRMNKGLLKPMDGSERIESQSLERFLQASSMYDQAVSDQEKVGCLGRLMGMKPLSQEQVGEMEDKIINGLKMRF